MAETSYDLIIIGSGPGGYVAAIRASQLGLKTAIVERDELGGICLNWGCIPTKALLRSAEIYHTLHRLEEFGLKADNISFDATAIVKRSRAVAGQLSNGVKFLMKKNKVDVIEGAAKLKSAGRVSVEGKSGTTEYAAKNIILPLVRGHAHCRASSPTANSSGLTVRPWCLLLCRSLCWLSAPVRSASNLLVSIGPSALM